MRIQRTIASEILKPVLNSKLAKNLRKVDLGTSFDAALITGTLFMAGGTLTNATVKYSNVESYKPPLVQILERGLYGLANGGISSGLFGLSAGFLGASFATHAKHKEIELLNKEAFDERRNGQLKQTTIEHYRTTEASRKSRKNNE